MNIIQLYVEFGEGILVFTDDDCIEFDEVTKFTIDELDAILTEAKAFREYRNSRIPEKKHEEAVKSKCKPNVITKEMLIDTIPNDNNIKEVIDINEAHENKPQVLIEVPTFSAHDTICTYHQCNNSQYWTTADGRIKIDPPEPYDVHIYTTVAEVQRLRSMTARELKAFYPAYEKQTYANKRYALRMFLLDIKDEVFPPVNSISITIPHGLDNVPTSVIAWPVADAEPPQEHEDTTTPTPEPADVPIDPYVLKSRMSKRTVGLWEKFADPSKVKT